jgi:hypothetical protein
MAALIASNASVSVGIADQYSAAYIRMVTGLSERIGARSGAQVRVAEKSSTYDLAGALHLPARP